MVNLKTQTGKALTSVLESEQARDLVLVRTRIRAVYIETMELPLPELEHLSKLLEELSISVVGVRNKLRRVSTGLPIP